MAAGKPFDKAPGRPRGTGLKRQAPDPRPRRAPRVTTTITRSRRNASAISFKHAAESRAGPHQETCRIMAGNRLFSGTACWVLPSRPPPGWLTWYTRPTATRASPNSTADHESLGGYYCNQSELPGVRGSPETQVTISPDNQNIQHCHLTVSGRPGPAVTGVGWKATSGPRRGGSSTIQLWPGPVLQRRAGCTEPRAFTVTTAAGYAFANVRQPARDRRAGKTQAVITWSANPDIRAPHRHRATSGPRMKSSPRDAPVRGPPGLTA